MDTSRSESSWCGVLGAVNGVMVGPGFCWDGQTNWMDSMFGCWCPKSRNRTDTRIGFGFGLGFGFGIGLGDRSQLCRMEAVYTTIDNRGRDASRPRALE